MSVLKHHVAKAFRWPLILSLCVGCPPLARAGQFLTLHAFAAPAGNPLNSRVETGDLVVGPDGSLYGTVDFFPDSDTGAPVPGEVFRLSPPASGKTDWSYSVLHTFTHDDGNCYCGLRMDKAGALYVTLQASVRYGRAIKLTAPANGQGPWTETVLHEMLSPYGSIALDRNGVIYGGGEDPRSGTHFIYSLAPPASPQGQWTYSVLWTQPTSSLEATFGLFLSATGSLIGRGFAAPYNTDAVWELTPPGAGHTAWSMHIPYMNPNESTLFPATGVPIADRQLNLFSYSDSVGMKTLGSVFRLHPPAAGKSTWSRDVLYSFKGGTDSGSPTSLVESAQGKLYGTAICFSSDDLPQDCADASINTIFSVTPRDYGGHLLPWNFRTLYTFSGGADGSGPTALVKTSLPDGTFALLGTTTRGGANKYGTIFEYIP